MASRERPDELLKYITAPKSHLGHNLEKEIEPPSQEISRSATGFSLQGLIDLWPRLDVHDPEWV